MQLELHRPSENSPVRISRRDFRIMSFLRRNAIDLEPVKSSRIASAIAIKRNIVSLGYCSKRTHPFQKRFAKNPDAIYLHAETNAIAKLAKSSESGCGAAMFVTHAPCIDCAKLVYQSGIASVYYKNDYRSTQGLEFLTKSNVDVIKV